jgi:outer membrane receptor for ferrienterochelin and colicins
VACSGQWFQGRAARDRRNSPLDEHRTREQSLLSAETMLTVLDGPRTWITGVRAELEAFEQSLERISAQNNETRSSVLEEVPHVDLLSAALFGQLGWELGERFTLLPGLRTEVHDSVGLVAAPRLAVAWQTSDDVRLRAGGGRGFRVPSAKEYGFLFDHTALGYRVLGNSELRPESSWGVNADAVWSLTADLRVQVSAFHNWVNDLIDTAFVGQGTAGIDDFSYVNVGRARTFGSDVGLTWLLGRRFRSQVAYSYLFTKNEDQGTPLASRPHHTWLSTFTYEPVKGAALTFRQRTVSRAWVSAGVFSPAFNTSDVLFSRRFNPYLEAHAGVLNLLDIKQEPLQLGDQRSVTGRMFVVGLIGSYEGDQ